jgi:hypothetical protein
MWVVLNMLHVSANSPCPVQRICKEVVRWNSLHHPNVLPLLGMVMDETHFAIVSEWMVHGPINEFVRWNIDADRLKLVCFSFGVLTFACY